MNIIKNYKVFVKLAGLLLIIGLVGCGNDNATTSGTSDGEQAAGEPTKGGTLNVAYSADPDTLDWMYTGASSTRDIGWHIFETLFALNKNYEVKPMIAKDYKVSEAKTVYTINLREDVKFHDGTTVTAEDVVASIDRWRKVSSVGSIASEHIEHVKKIDKHTVEIKVKQVYSPLLADMAAPKSALMIIPSEIAESAGEQPLKPEQLVGTGPYKFDEWDRGSQIVLSRFEEYSAREEEKWGGLTGKKVAYFDTINFKIVKDPQSMINGVKTGLYDYAQSIPPDLYQVVETNPKIDPVTYINGYSIITPDKSEAPFDELKVRKALNQALDKKTIAKAAYGNEKFYSIDGALFSPEQTELYTKEGTDQYLAYDKEKAKQLLEKSSYNGEPIKIMYANNYADYGRIAEVVKQQLEEIGFTVELVAYEWATYLEKWGDPANWDLVVIGWSTRFSPNELGMLSMDTSSSGWYKSERWGDLIDQWATAETADQRKEILADMNQTVYEELPFTKIANESTLDIKRDKIKDYDSWIGPRFWNTWKSE